MFKKILIAYDGSEGAKLAGTEIHMLAVGRIPEYAETISEVEEAREQARGFYSKIMDEAAANLRQAGLSAQVHVDFGKPADVILRVAEDLAADLIVMGTKPHSALRRRVLGATVDKVVDHAVGSVLVVRR